MLRDSLGLFRVNCRLPIQRGRLHTQNLGLNSELAELYFAELFGPKVRKKTAPFLYKSEAA
jgi:hypothetical protein